MHTSASYVHTSKQKGRKMRYAIAVANNDQVSSFCSQSSEEIMHAFTVC